MRVSLIQIFAGCIAFASVLAMFQLSSTDDVVWRNQPLELRIPPTPTEFQDNGREAPCEIIGSSGWIQYESGPKMFRKLYRRGWKRCRYDFYVNNDETRWMGFDLNRKFELSKNEWGNDHFRYPYHFGYLTCSQQIEKLLDLRSESNLRKALCYSKNWHTIPLLFVFLVSVSSIQFLKPRPSRG